MTKFLNHKIKNYFKTSTTPAKCIEYLLFQYPHKLNNFDHMAFRTITHSKFNELSQIITNHNFENKGTVTIPQKSRKDITRFAHWFKNDNFIVPRIFLSMGYTTLYHDSIINSEFYSNRKKYTKLRKLGDDYITWTWLYDNEINHLAIDMSDYEDFENTILKMAEDLNLDMNQDEGLFQTSKDGKLIQCSTKADFYEGRRKNYIEFVKRIDGRDGFEGNNAYGIFQSTK
jgi:hypothetical protein